MPPRPFARSWRGVIRRALPILAVLLPVLPLPVLALLATPAGAAVPTVVVSIKPVHALAAGLMRGVGTPALLVKGSDNPHTFSLRPSDAAVLQGADLVFWMGPTVEPALEGPVRTLARRARVIELTQAPGMTLLPLRGGGLWTGHEGEGKAEGHDTARDDHLWDGHLWLDPDNARAMARAMESALEAADPADGQHYRANLAAVLADIDAVDQEVAALLAPLRRQPFIVYHDAFQYFEAHYHLDGIGALTTSPDSRPGAGGLAHLRDRVVALGGVCVFGEPPFEPRQLAPLTDGTRARQGVLDPEGVALSPGPDLYAHLMRANAQALAACLTSLER